MPVLTNIGFLATCKEEGGQGEIHPIKNAAVAWEDDTISWVGREADLPSQYYNEDVFDADGKMVVPGLVDCHTHLAFGGWRPDEFAMRVQGKSYLDIANAGGGILSTVKETRRATEDELYKKASGFLKEMAELGVTTVECKSGYGLSVEDELKTLRVYKRLAEDQPMHIVPTFLGAHTIPPEYKDDRQAYIDLVIEDMIPEVAERELAEFCDIFTEESAFNIEESRRILTAAKAAGLTPKLHADQLTSCGGAELAAEVGAASADHLEKISDEGIAAMAKAGVVGVTLPLASLYTQEDPLNCRKLVDRGVEVAVATDFNPGSAPSYDLPLAMMLTCNQGRLSPTEVLKGTTIYAAKAIKRERKVGSIEKGKSADFAIIDAPDPDFWMYHYKGAQCLRSFRKGRKLF
ncbi:imidazolonepropionase [Aliifodinibius salipaludis]|uniref:Imidazolonepropionase n=1 Tax=Fodinibius salipaludis TaxID=2032627 RepID=A0A2A2GEH8_9BACT|nr:imidazolonepropionase [Aliifodinibius salipaludis]PAU95317.1 imidazolonepropionase [Aliifodinibius salipaludis]